MKRFGLNVAASRFTTGNHEIYQQLESELVRFFAVESATLVSGLSADALTSGDTEVLGRLMTYSHAVLARAGASNRRLDGLGRRQGRALPN